MKKAIIPFLLTLCCSQGVTGQQLQPVVLSSAGSQETAIDLVLDWTLGETVTGTAGTNPVLTQGFHQGELKINTVVLHPQPTGKVVVFPNPTSGQIEIWSRELAYTTIRLSDVSGNILFASEHPQTTIDLSGRIAGMYILQFWDGHRLVAVAQIQKF